MNMFRTLVLLSLLAMFGLTSCEKTISKKACFTFSKLSAKLGDTVYIFNCSEGYQRCEWYLPNGVVDTNRHTRFIPTFSGPNPVALRIGNYLFTDTIGTVKIITIEP
jgi:hypothetical protein